MAVSVGCGSRSSLSKVSIPLSGYRNAWKRTVFSILDTLKVKLPVFVVNASGGPPGPGYTVYALVGHCLD